MELQLPDNDEMDEEVANDPVNSLFYLKSGGTRRVPLPFSDKLAVCFLFSSFPLWLVWFVISLACSSLAVVPVARAVASDAAGPRLHWRRLRDVPGRLRPLRSVHSRAQDAGSLPGMEGYSMFVNLVLLSFLF
jgi:hypothetical protein